MNRAAQIVVVAALSAGFGSSGRAQGVVTQKNLSLSMARTIAEGALDESACAIRAGEARCVETFTIRPFLYAGEPMEYICYPTNGIGTDRLTI